MSKAEKLLRRFLSKPTDFTYDELRKLLKAYGYDEDTAGKTSGSRVTFVNSDTKHIIKLHKPHPSPCLKQYQMDDIEEALKSREVIK